MTKAYSTARSHLKPVKPKLHCFDLVKTVMIHLVKIQIATRHDALDKL